MGLKLRANPHNPGVLRKVTVVLAVPPLVAAPHSEGKWNELQRTLAWTLDTLSPGDAREWQLALPRLEEQSLEVPGEDPPRFPLVVRAEQDAHWSGMWVTVATPAFSDDSAMQPKLVLETSGAVLHRKV